MFINTEVATNLDISSFMYLKTLLCLTHFKSLFPFEPSRLLIFVFLLLCCGWGGGGGAKRKHLPEMDWGLRGLIVPTLNDSLFQNWNDYSSTVKGGKELTPARNLYFIKAAVIDKGYVVYKILYFLISSVARSTWTRADAIRLICVSFSKFSRISPRIINILKQI